MKENLNDEFTYNPKLGISRNIKKNRRDFLIIKNFTVITSGILSKGGKSPGRNKRLNVSNNLSN